MVIFVLEDGFCTHDMLGTLSLNRHGLVWDGTLESTQHSIRVRSI